MLVQMSRERDPRAWWLDDDPFDKKKHNDVFNKNSENQFNNNPFQEILNDYFGNSQRHAIPVHKGSIWHFSKIEVQHLTLHLSIYQLKRHIRALMVQQKLSFYS